MKKLLLIALLAATGCTTITQNNGAELRQVKLDQINPESTKADVFNLLGSPSTKSNYGQETWYYISSQIKRVLTAEDEITKQSVVAVTFNENEKVDNVEIYDQSARREFATSDRITPTAGKKLNVMEQILGNVGKFNTDSDTGSIGSRAPSGGRTPY